MLVPQARGELSEQLFAALRSGGPAPTALLPGDEEDLQVALWVLYELHYRGFDDVDPAREWDPGLIALRGGLEDPFEQRLRDLAGPLTSATEPDRGVVVGLEQVVAGDTWPSVAAYLRREATEEQFREFLAMRSVYHLKETDAHTWLLPRLAGAPKVALAELVYDEFGDGRPESSHQHLYAEALAEAGLEPTYGHYLDDAPAHVLAVNNAMSLFGLHRRLRGAGAGHLAAFEMTSSLPCRKILQGAQRLGFGPAVQRYFDEHVEADAVHEHLAARGICGAMVAAEPDLAPDVLFGAAACVVLDGLSAQALLEDWKDGRTGMRTSPLDPAA
jgi:hypothetical protein